jgi:hypothetical protein
MHGVPWNLVPRTIPPMEETQFKITSVVRSNNPGFRPGLLQEKPISHRIEPNDTLIILFDQQTLTTAYPRLIVSGGKGSRIKMIYAKSLYDENKRKGNQSETAEKKMIRYYDIFMPGGQENALFTSLDENLSLLQMEVIATGPL